MRSHTAGFTLRVTLGGAALLLVGCQSGTAVGGTAGATGAASTAHPRIASSSHAKGHAAAGLSSGAVPAATADATPGPFTSAPQSPTPRPTLSPSPGLKPPIRGLVYLQGVPPASLRPLMGGYDIQGRGGDYGSVSWAELQPTAGGPIAPDNPIDQAIAGVRAWNAANPDAHETLLLRINAGVHSPAWAMNLGGPCVDVSDPVFNLHGCTPRFWTAQYGDAFYQFEAALAAKYDAVPEIGEVVIARDMTFYNEPMLRQITDPARSRGCWRPGTRQRSTSRISAPTWLQWAGTGSRRAWGTPSTPTRASATGWIRRSVHGAAHGVRQAGARVTARPRQRQRTCCLHPGTRRLRPDVLEHEAARDATRFPDRGAEQGRRPVRHSSGIDQLGAGNVELPPGFNTVLTDQQLTTLSLALRDN